MTQAQYPDHLILAGVAYPVSYHFDPEAEDDGVTLTVPAAMLPQLPVHALEWLVPGLLREKCIALLKSLPKSIRRQVVPIPDWVDAALETLVPDQRPLTEALGEFIRRRTSTRVHPDDWRLDLLEPHLIMNIRVVDHAGKPWARGAICAPWSSALKQPPAQGPRRWPNRLAMSPPWPDYPKSRCLPHGSPPRQAFA